MAARWGGEDPLEGLVKVRMETIYSDQHVDSQRGVELSRILVKSF
jgi:hypothetical protein